MDIAHMSVKGRFYKFGDFSCQNAGACVVIKLPIYLKTNTVYNHINNCA